MTVSVLVVDDQPSVVELLLLLLEQDGRYGDVWAADSAASALACVGQYRPDAVVLDAGLGRDDGLALVQEMRRLDPGVSVVVFSSAPFADWAATIEAGADAFIEKGTDLDALLDVVVDLASADSPHLRSD